MSWLLAFAVHSTLWLGLAWVITRVRPGMHARVRETLWHTAMAASLIAPTAQTFAPEGASSFWALPLPSMLLAEAPMEAEAAPTRPLPPISPEMIAALQSGAVQFNSVEPTATLAPTSEPWTRDDFVRAGMALWAGISVLLYLSYLGRLGAMRRRLNPRDLVETAPERFALDQLSRRAGLRRMPRLTESENIGSPLAFGVGRKSEICIPTRALHELDHDQFCAMLGHEVAHHMRRDPVRLALSHLLQAVFFFQPLFRVAHRQLHLAAEEQCDAWGASHLEDRLAMARCLTEVASWVLPQDRRLLVAGMARRRSQLGTRVDRLMDERCGFHARGGSARAMGSALLLALAPWLAPTLAPATPAPAALEAPVRDGLALAEFRPMFADELVSSMPVPAWVDSQLAEVNSARVDAEIQLALILQELGPLAYGDAYQDKLLRILGTVERLREMHGRLRIALAALFPGEGPSPEGRSIPNTTNQ